MEPDTTDWDTTGLDDMEREWVEKAWNQVEGRNKRKFDEARRGGRGFNERNLDRIGTENLNDGRGHNVQCSSNIL